MPQYKLEWSLETKNSNKIRPQTNDFQWCFKFMCTKCHEITSNPVSFRSIDKVEISNSRGSANFVMKCKFCKSEGTVDILEKSLQSYLSEKGRGFQTLVIIEGRGFEPTEW
jgi:hypothetical protein